MVVYDYPGFGHLFADPSKADEFQPAEAELMWSRVLDFLSRVEPSWQRLGVPPPVGESGPLSGTWVESAATRQVSGEPRFEGVTGRLAGRADVGAPDGFRGRGRLVGTDDQ